MRVFAFLLACILLAVGRIAAAYEPGDMVVVVRRSALKTDVANLDVVAAGSVLAVQKAQGDWLWISSARPGWIATSNVVPFDEAVDYFTAAIRRQPQNATHYAARAIVWTAKNEFDIALADFNEAIRLDPAEVAYQANRAGVYLRKRDSDRAIVDLTEVIRRGFHPSIAHNNRGLAYAQQQDYAHAESDFRASIALDPSFVLPLGNLAALLACCPDSRFRDGREAVELAKKACEMTRWLDAHKLHCLACAYAENDAFADAVTREQTAIELTPPSKRSARAAYERALDQFNNRQPFHEIVELE